MKFLRQHFLTACCICSIFLSVIIIGVVTSCSSEELKFKTAMVFMFVALLFQFVIVEPIYFVIKASIIYCLGKTRSKWKWPKLINHNKKSTQQRQAANFKYKRTEYLQTRLGNYKSRISLPKIHAHAEMNLKYKFIALEMRMHFKYFVVLLMLVIYTRNELTYYNTIKMIEAQTERALTGWGLDDIDYIEDLYDFIERMFVDCFNEGIDYNAKIIQEPGWVNYYMAKLLGVVRLRQLQLLELNPIGLDTPSFNDDDYMPAWDKNLKKYPYMDKLDRMYTPWKPLYKESFLTSSLGMSKHYGDLHVYPENVGYGSLLARNVNDSRAIMNFLKKNDWLNDNTVAVFMDFTLYNVDANIFTVCTLLVEQSPFGSITFRISVDSHCLLSNINEMKWWEFLLIFLYLMVLIQLSKYIILNAYYGHKFFKSFWNILDICIIFLNILWAYLIYIRENAVAHLLHRFENSSKLDFVDFREASFIDKLITYNFGLLVLISTLRLLRIMQFGSVFRLFNRTIWLARYSLISTLFMLLIFLYAFSLCVYIINSSLSTGFRSHLKTFTNCMSHSMGFNEDLKPNDFEHGGAWLGLILFAIMIFSLSIFLLNMFITIVIEHFNTANEERKNEPEQPLNFFEYLKMEYLPECCKSKKFYQNPQRTVRENIEEYLNEREEKLKNQNHFDNKTEFDDRMQHMRLVAKALKTQVEILNHKWNIMTVIYDSDEDDDI